MLRAETWSRATGVANRSEDTLPATSTCVAIPRRRKGARSSHPCRSHLEPNCRIKYLADLDALRVWAGSLDQGLTPLMPENLPWTFFLTLTFRHSIPAHHAITAGQRLTSWCSRWVGRERGRSGLFKLLLWSAESHSTGAVHLHALSVTTPAASLKHCSRCQPRISSLREPWRKLKESWFQHHGIARVRPYDARLRFGAERYVIKYILHEACLDWGVETW